MDTRNVRGQIKQALAEHIGKTRAVLHGKELSRKAEKIKNGKKGMRIWINI